ncbi:hypothetical protein KIN20_015850 [Parelaphostrongylus tenuis]|uniref:Uncharacterized protein n=1 Tax=Parelaphostrongylus tenuis TaxID=148309 RepID=A0AAD5N1B6_PARTN|nr:hypothetical protein KIN20_015850 [Parelaphostrongylus tenuis]
MSSDAVEAHDLLLRHWRKALSPRAKVDEINELEEEGRTSKYAARRWLQRINAKFLDLEGNLPRLGAENLDSSQIIKLVFRLFGSVRCGIVLLHQNTHSVDQIRVLLLKRVVELALLVTIELGVNENQVRSQFTST